MNVFITGVNGYIGSKIAIDVLKKYDGVIGIDARSGSVSQLTNNFGFQFHKANITDITTFPPETREGNILIHCAALVYCLIINW